MIKTTKPLTKKLKVLLDVYLNGTSSIYGRFVNTIVNEDLARVVRLHIAEGSRDWKDALRKLEHEDSVLAQPYDGLYALTEHGYMIASEVYEKAERENDLEVLVLKQSSATKTDGIDADELAADNDAFDAFSKSMEVFMQNMETYKQNMAAYVSSMQPHDKQQEPDIFDDVAFLKDENRRLMAENAAKQKTIDILNSKLDELHKKLDIAVKSGNDTVIRQRSTLDKVYDELRDLKYKNEVLDADFKKLQVQKTALEEMTVRQRQQLNAVYESLKAANDRNEKLEDSLAKSANACTEMAKWFNGLKDGTAC